MNRRDTAEKSIEMWLRGILSRIMYKEFNKDCLQKKLSNVHILQQKQLESERMEEHNMYIVNKEMSKVFMNLLQSYKNQRLYGDKRINLTEGNKTFKEIKMTGIVNIILKYIKGFTDK